jgi:hypothetical protein
MAEGRVGHPLAPRREAAAAMTATVTLSGAKGQELRSG